MTEIVERIFLRETFIFSITLIKEYILILKFKNSRIAENIFPEKISHDNSISSLKIKDKFFSRDLILGTTLP